MGHRQSAGVVIAITVVGLVAGYMLVDLLRHKSGVSSVRCTVVCPKSRATRITVEHEQPAWWCEHCKTLHWTASTVEPVIVSGQQP